MQGRSVPVCSASDRPRAHGCTRDVDRGAAQCGWRMHERRANHKPAPQGWILSNKAHAPLHCSCERGQLKLSHPLAGQRTDETALEPFLQV